MPPPPVPLEAAALSASCRLAWSCPLTLKVGFVTVPSAFTNEPPPSAFAALDATLYSCEPLTASLLDAPTVPAIRFVIFVPEAPASVTRAFAEPASYATNALFTTPLESVVSPSFFNWLRLTASLSCDASATLVIWRLIDALPTEMVFARLAVELAPSATAPVAVALVLAPIASDWAALAEALSPSAIAEVLNARAFEPIATLCSDADAFAPSARLSEPANVPLPIATPEPSPSAPLPIATAPVFEALGPVSGVAMAPVPIATPSVTSAVESLPMAVAFVPVADPSVTAAYAEAPAKLRPPTATCARIAVAIAVFARLLLLRPFCSSETATHVPVDSFHTDLYVLFILLLTPTKLKRFAFAARHIGRSPSGFRMTKRFLESRSGPTFIAPLSELLLNAATTNRQ
ncbi:hypothetical protein AWB68_05125 [Caballeronia choica]|uniref:Uncharacterized protein n=1 Tax=Caballeronia choica TaxID=326476 RepID=A0A158K7J9_9BURK|nr:hypothetical protein AWB68_05125 [Caballeronia choica]